MLLRREPNQIGPAAVSLLMKSHPCTSPLSSRLSRIAASLGLVALLGALAACSPVRLVNAITPTATLVRTEGIAYVQRSDHPRQRLDIYQPATDATGQRPRPVVVFFYGGAWQEGARGDYLFLAEALTQRGYVVVIPDYRVYPEVRYPAFLEDGAEAVAWTTRHIAQYGGDPARIFLMGHSAGAHIAAMLSLDHRYLDARQVRRGAITGWVGLAGPYDFLPLTEPNVIALFATEPVLDRTQPIHYAATAGGREAPRALLLHGDADTRVYPRNSVNLERALREAGTPVQLALLPGVGHVGIMARFTRVWRDSSLIDRIDTFLRTAAPPAPNRG